MSDLEGLLRSARSSGLRERGERGFNRLRMVLASSSPGLMEKAARIPFTRLTQGDDKVHLHVIDETTLPF